MNTDALAHIIDHRTDELMRFSGIHPAAWGTSQIKASYRNHVISLMEQDELLFASPHPATAADPGYAASLATTP